MTIDQYSKSFLMFIVFSISLFCCENNQQNSQSDLDVFISQTDKIYKNLVKDAKVEDISEEAYNNINTQELKFSAGANGNIKQKVLQGNLGINIIYQKIENNNKKYFRKVSGSTDNELQKKIAEITLVGLKCYDFSKKLMDEVCKRDGIDAIIKASKSETSEKVSPESNDPSTRRGSEVKNKMISKNTTQTFEEYSSTIRDADGKGVAEVEIYCPNCTVKQTTTNKDGSFQLNGQFSPEDAFWQTTIYLTKGVKKLSVTIYWREKSPEPIIF